MVLLGCVYLLTAVCMRDGVEEVRRYIGMFKTKCSQQKEGARQRRERKHIERPVRWLSSAEPATMVMRCVGHVMDFQMTLVEEAIQAAVAIVDRGPPCRGGPWSGAHLGNAARDLAAAVRRRAARAATPAAARASVLEYALSLPDDNPLKVHVQNRFYSDSAERKMSQPRGRKCYLSGSQKRVRWCLVPGTTPYDQPKWGGDVEANRASDNKRRKRCD